MARVLSRVGVKVGLEDVAGTYKAPTQIVKLEEVITPDIEFDSVEIPNFSFFAGSGDVVNIADWRRGNIDIKTSLYKDISFYRDLLAICNLKSKEDTTKKTITFTPDTHSEKSASIDLLLPDRKFKLKGAKANLKMEGKVGDKLTVTFETKAAFEEREMGEQSISDSKAGEMMIIRRLGGMSINGVAINLSEFSFDMGNEINYEKFTNVGEYHISDRSTKLTLKMRLEKNGSEGFDEFKSGAVSSFEAIFRDAAGNTIWELKIPRAKVSKQPGFSDSDGIFVLEREFLALSNKGDDNFELIYHKQD